jgi:hydroxyacylglutathione hydrolase
MSLTPIIIPQLSDNYSYVIVCPQTKEAGIVDPAEHKSVLKIIKQNHLKPVIILNTHHHFDHTEGNQKIAKKYKIPIVAGKEDAPHIKGDVMALDDNQTLSIGTLNFQAIPVPGHTMGHVAYYGEGMLFSGDCLFVCGCGRVFEGSAEQMVRSLETLKKLPEQTRVYAGHEYTLSNCEFALTLESSNSALCHLYQTSKEQQALGKPTIPSTILAEKSFNPFLRTDSPAIIQHLTQKGFAGLDNPVNVFAAIRKLKDER